MKSKLVDLPPIDWNTFDITTCNRCKLCHTRFQVVKPIIVPNCKITIVGIAPGAEEDRWGQPFIGASGRILDDCLNQVGINRSQVSIINCVLCRPPKNRDPESDELEACNEILKHYIELANPSVIVPMGNIPLKVVMKSSGITKKNGLILEHKNFPGKKIVPSVHPAFVVRDPGNRELMVKALANAKKVADGNLVYTKTKVEYVNTYEKFDMMLKDLGSTDRYALDIENSSLLNWKESFIICIAFSNREGHAYVLPWVVGDEEYYNVCKQHAVVKGRKSFINNIDEFCELYKVPKPKYFWKGTDVKERLKEFLQRKDQIKVLHNWKYDFKVLKEHGLTIGAPYRDTMIEDYTLHAHKKRHNLKDLALDYTNYGDYDKEMKSKYIKPKSKKTLEEDSFAIIPIDELTPYAGTDADVTLILDNLLYPRIVNEGFETLYNSFLMPASDLIITIEENGFKFDKKYLENGIVVLEKAISDIDNQLTETANINFNSPKQLATLLFDYKKLPVIKHTDKGDRSTDASVLEALKHLDPIPGLLLDRRKLHKTLSTYFRGIKLRSTVWSDERIHADFFITGTETGRLSSSNPNMQNLTRDFDLLTNLGLSVRGIFISSSQNHRLIEIDYSQAELRLIAEFSRDPVLYNVFLQDKDPHAEFAVRLYYKELIQDMEAGKIIAKEVVTKEQRHKAKTGNFSLVYGKDAENFGKENGIPIDESLYIHKTFWETYQGVEVYKNNVIEKAKSQGYVMTKFGRRREIPKLRSGQAYIVGEAEREAFNTDIQATASDITLYSLLRIQREISKQGWDAKIVNAVHDAGYFDVHVDCLQEFLTSAVGIMQDVPMVSLKMVAEPKVGTRLGKLEEWARDSSNVWSVKK